MNVLIISAINPDALFIHVKRFVMDPMNAPGDSILYLHEH